MAELYSHNEETMKNGGIVIARGMSEYEDDKCVAEVYDRADHNMYDNKISLKAGR